MLLAAGRNSDKAVDVPDAVVRIAEVPTDCKSGSSSSSAYANGSCGAEAGAATGTSACM